MAAERLDGSIGRPSNLIQVILAKGTDMLRLSFLTLLTLVFFSIQTRAATALEPTLLQDCQMGAFQMDRMPAERSSFWRISEDYEIHDLKAERAYNEKLTEQVIECYRRAEEIDLAGCHFNEMALDSRKLNSVMPSSEYFHWKVSEEQGRNQIYPARIRYMRSLSGRIQSCFSRENLRNLTPAAFTRLYDTIKTMERITDDYAHPPLGFMPQGTAYHECIYCNMRDRETTYFISLRGTTVRKNHLGAITIED